MQKTLEQEKILLQVLQELYPDSSKAALRSWIKVGRVTVDEKLETHPSALLAAGQQVRVWPSRQITPEGLLILYEDAHIVVIDKPAGLLSVATDRGSEPSAHLYLKRRYQPHVVYVVHRLDRETSGVMVFARTQTAFRALKQALKEKTMERQYLAIVQGKMEETSGTWESYLFQKYDMSVVPVPEGGNGELAITHYQVEGTVKRWTLLRLRLETGRKHQIRVHCQQAGCPVAGDQKYGGPSFSRLALHSSILQLIHPISGKALRFELPTPTEFLQFDWR